MNDEGAPPTRSWLPWALLLAILAATAAIRWRYLDVPLERDEGEYAYMGQLMLRGIPPYEQAYNMKLPGIYAVYAGILGLFGETREGIHLGLLLANALSTVLLFALARRLTDAPTALASALLFAFLSLGSGVHGMFANAEHFVLPFALGGLLLVLRAEEAGRRAELFLGALLLGLSYLVKQHGIFFAAAAGLILVARAVRPFDLRRLLVRSGLFGAGVLLPFGLTCAALWAAGVFETFWFWTFDYARAYTQQVSLADAPPILREFFGPIFRASPAIWILALIGLVLFAYPRHLRGQRLHVSAFALLSAGAVVPGLLFRPHYFLLLLPATALLAAASLRTLASLVARSGAQRLASSCTLVLLVGALGHSCYTQREVLLGWSAYELSRNTYGPNPFPESPAIAEWIREDTEESDSIAILGSEPQICFYAGRRSATGYIYTYALMEDHEFVEQMQDQMIREIEASEPKYLVWVDCYASWLFRPESTRTIFYWLDRYARDFELVGRVEIEPSPGHYRKAVEKDPGRPPLPASFFTTRYLREAEVHPDEPVRMQATYEKAFVSVYRRR